MFLEHFSPIVKVAIHEPVFRCVVASLRLRWVGKTKIPNKNQFFFRFEPGFSQSLAACTCCQLVISVSSLALPMKEDVNMYRGPSSSNCGNLSENLQFSNRFL
jgi:hypothetical protein